MQSQIVADRLEARHGVTRERVEDGLLAAFKAARQQRSLCEYRAWYPQMGDILGDIADHYGRDRYAVTWAFSELSPRMRLNKNIEALFYVLEGGSHAAYPGLKDRWVAAHQALALDPDLMSHRATGQTGNKVAAFTRALMGDRDAVVIDAIMLRLMGVDPEHRLTRAQYTLMSEWLSDLADTMGESPRDFQAIAWSGERGTNG